MQSERDIKLLERLSEREYRMDLLKSIIHDGKADSGSRIKALRMLESMEHDNPHWVHKAQLAKKRQEKKTVL